MLVSPGCTDEEDEWVLGWAECCCGDGSKGAVGADGSEVTLQAAYLFLSSCMQPLYVSPQVSHWHCQCVSTPGRT